jgi:uncharacterized phage infection (PIP) family protein YhgE
MSENDPPEGSGEVNDTELFDEWLDQAADSKGIPKEELMDEMLSSYWILDELTELMRTETERSTAASSTTPTHRGLDTEIDPELDSEPALSTPESKDEGDESDEDGLSEEHLHEFQVAISKLIESQGTVDPRHSSGESQSDSPASTETEDSASRDLHHQVEALDSKLEALDSRQDGQFERLSNELQLILDRVETLERDQDQFVAEDEIDALTSKIQEVDTQLKALRTTDDELASRMEREFDSIEQLFHRVIDALGDVESEVDAVTESQQSEMASLQQREAERKQLEKLKNGALVRGIKKGRCESCAQDLDLGLLESPECPDCGARFIGIGSSSWNPFKPPEIKTEPPSVKEP